MVGTPFEKIQFFLIPENMETINFKIIFENNCIADCIFINSKNYIPFFFPEDRKKTTNQ